MGHIIKTTALMLLPLVLSGGHTRAADPKIITRAADPKIITLSCDGTVTDTRSPTDRQPPKPIEKMGVVVNLNERTVTFQGFVAPIASVDAARINFNGKQIEKTGYYTQRIDGTLDRVTGHMIADAMTLPTTDTRDRDHFDDTQDHYDVLCKATNRVF
jgi:hypothetical protein